MLPPMELLEQQVSRIDQQLMMYLIIEQRETNRLLREMKEPVKHAEDELKRPELMKRMAALPEKPQGWNKWSNEQIVEYLKGVA